MLEPRKNKERRGESAPDTRTGAWKVPRRDRARETLKYNWKVGPELPWEWMFSLPQCFGFFPLLLLFRLTGKGERKYLVTFRKHKTWLSFDWWTNFICCNCLKQPVLSICLVILSKIKVNVTFMSEMLPMFFFPFPSFSSFFQLTRKRKEMRPKPFLSY